jgi:hypothetical protein
MKTVKSCIWMAAATMLVATLGACSNDDITAIQTPVQKGNVVTLTATLSPKDGETTRALTDPGDGTLTSAWAIGEELEVMYEDTHGGTPSARGKITAVDGSGKATVTVDLVDPQTGTAYFHYPYNRTSGLKDTKIDQIGALNDIGANFDEFEGNGTITVTAGVPSLPDDVALTRNVCVWKLKFTDGGLDITSDIISLSINDGTREYLITPSSLDAIYVAMFGCTGATITIKAATATGVYSASKAGITLQAGKSYHSTVALAAAASDTYRVFTSKTDYTDEAIPGGATTVTSGTNTWTDGTYVVSGNVTIDAGVTVSGATAVNLILKDGASLTVNGTITGGNILNIYGQELSTGKLTVNANDINVGVGNLNIHGGIINVPTSMQGIETMNLNIYHGTVTTAGAMNGFMIMGDMHIYGGNVTATATNGAALQIYGSGKPGSLTVSGGTFTARGTGSSHLNKGILVEEGEGKGTASIMISGGTVIASGGSDDDTNSGADAIDVQGTLTISGGAIVTADGGTDTNGNGGGCGISVREGSSAGGSTTISGGTITATGGDQMPAINVDKNLTISGGTTEITATGGMMMEGILAMGNTTITGGTVNSYGGTNGPGFETSSITVSGGKLTAVGGDAPAASDSDGRSGIIGDITVSGGIVTATGGAKDGSGSDGLGVDDSSTISVGPEITFFEGDTPNPTSTGTPPTCTKRYVIIK